MSNVGYYVNNNLIHLYCNKNDIENLKKLIDSGADVNAKNKDGDTPLHTATWKGNIEIVKLLIENGANLNIQDSNGKTPLHLMLIMKILKSKIF